MPEGTEYLDTTTGPWSFHSAALSAIPDGFPLPSAAVGVVLRVLVVLGILGVLGIVLGVLCILGVLAILVFHEFAPPLSVQA